MIFQATGRRQDRKEVLKKAFVQIAGPKDPKIACRMIGPSPELI
jgi:hypothetical protein